MGTSSGDALKSKAIFLTTSSLTRRPDGDIRVMNDVGQLTDIVIDLLVIYLICFNMYVLRSAVYQRQNFFSTFYNFCSRFDLGEDSYFVPTR
jgi:hypothetical protein